MKISFSLLFLIVSFSCFSQLSSYNLDNDINFILYLGQNGQYSDIEFYGDKLIKQDYLNNSQKDSINYIIGFINFNRSNFDKSIHYFSNVSEQSMFFPKSTFYSELCYIEKGEFKSAYNHLNTTQLDRNNKLLLQLNSFELAGLSLLNREYATFDSLSNTFSTTNSVLDNEQQYLKKDYLDIKNLKMKSPLLAGTLSAIIPGLGLAYAGNRGQALSAFIRVVSLGALTTETYVKLGPKNPQFMISAALFSFFYVGNVWGSVLSVQIIKNEKLKEIDHNVVVGLRIPIDSFFK